MAVTHGMLEPGNVMISAPYYVAGRSSMTFAAAGGRLATLVNFGRVDTIGGGSLIPAPIRISAARVFLAVTAGALSTVSVELVKGTATVQDSGAPATERAVVRRKTTGYAAIATTEVSLVMSTTGAVVAGGNFSAVGEPFLIVGAGSAAAFGFADGVWSPADMVPITLEAGEAIACQVTTQGTAGVGVLGLCFDFLRQ